VASQNAESWFSTGAPPQLDRRNTAGGVLSGVSRFVVNGGPPRIGADGAHGQCDSSIRPASAGQMILNMKETARGLCSPGPGATTRYHTPGFGGHRTRHVIVGCIGCRQRHLR